jgi:hypothetical protein
MIFNVLHECTTAILTPPLLPLTVLPPYSYTLYSSVPPTLIILPTFTSSKSNALCGAFNYFVYSDIALTMLDVTFTFDPILQTLTVLSNDRTKLGTFTIEIIGYQGTYSSTYT